MEINTDDINLINSVLLKYPQPDRVTLLSRCMCLTLAVGNQASPQISLKNNKHGSMVANNITTIIEKLQDVSIPIISIAKEYKCSSALLRLICTHKRFAHLTKNIKFPVRLCGAYHEKIETVSPDEMQQLAEIRQRIRGQKSKRIINDDRVRLALIMEHHPRIPNIQYAKYFGVGISSISNIRNKKMLPQRRKGRNDLVVDMLRQYPNRALGLISHLTGLAYSVVYCKCLVNKLNGSAKIRYDYEDDSDPIAAHHGRQIYRKYMDAAKGYNDRSKAKKNKKQTYECDLFMAAQQIQAKLGKGNKRAKDNNSTQHDYTAEQLFN